MFIDQKPRQYYVSLLFGLGLYSTARVLTICIAGSLVTGEYRRLTTCLYETMPEWTLDAWLHFVAIRKMKRHFRVMFCGEMFTLKQSSLLVVVAFVLSYTAVLLQTETL